MLELSRLAYGQVDKSDPDFGKLQRLYGGGATQPHPEAGIQSISPGHSRGGHDLRG